MNCHPSLRKGSPAGYGWRATEDRRAKGVSPKLRRSAGRLFRLGYVYFLELSNGDIYVGSTDDLRRRLASHQNGHVVSTSKYLPAVLRSYVAVTDEVTVRRLERYFKSGSGKAFAKKRFLQKTE
jgi:predicted GIY-YIG superfamily endonuclease